MSEFIITTYDVCTNSGNISLANVPMGKLKTMTFNGAKFHIEKRTWKRFLGENKSDELMEREVSE